MYFRREIEERLKKWLQNTHLTLEVLGARQVGKTTTILHFSKENFKNIIYINLAMGNYEKFLSVLENTETEFDQYVSEDFEKRMIENGYKYENSHDTVIIIDEIQLDAKLYNHIRILTRSLKSRLIVTGSYLARALYDKKFFTPAGDLEIITMDTLSFSEFLNACGSSDFSKERLEELVNSEKLLIYKKFYETYQQIGGYPAVVDTLVKTGKISEAQDMLASTIRTFLQESKNYAEYLVDSYLLENALQAVCDVLLKEKQGGKNLYETIRNRINTRATHKVSTETTQNILMWLYECGLIGFCGKCVIKKLRSDFEYVTTPSERFYFKDIGVLNYYLNSVEANEGAIAGIMAENYMYIVLNRYLNKQTSYHKTPIFAVIGEYEIDFYLKDKKKRYLFEVKAGTGKAKSLEYAKNKGVADCYVYLSDSDNIKIAEESINLPLYLAEKIEFDTEESKKNELENFLNSIGLGKNVEREV